MYLGAVIGKVKVAERAASGREKHTPSLPASVESGETAVVKAELVPVEK